MMRKARPVKSGGKTGGPAAEKRKSLPTSRKKKPGTGATTSRKKKMPAELLERFKGKSAAKTKSMSAADKKKADMKMKAKKMGAKK